MAKFDPTQGMQPHEIAKYGLERQALEGGYLGKVFGTNKYAKQNIVATLMVLLIIIGGVGSYCDNMGEKSQGYWKLILPVLTTALGYLIGKHEG